MTTRGRRKRDQQRAVLRGAVAVAGQGDLCEIAESRQTQQAATRRRHSTPKPEAPVVQQRAGNIGL